MSAGGIDHLYVHVPFCDGKCRYCGFYSFAADASVRRGYVAYPGRELALLAESGGWTGRPSPRTLYFGGGTPGVLGADGLAALVAGLRRSMGLRGIEEWTVELSPATAGPDLLAALRSCGVNRISMGAQSFDDGVLKAIGRRHSSVDTACAVRNARNAGFANVGLDLIAGLPGVDHAGWQASLEQAVALAPEHVSVYALSVEPGTDLQRQAAAGLELPGDEAVMDALAQAETVLARAGLERYELSNYALPEKACRHNLACWRGEDYVGLGPAAASRTGLQRRTNRADAAAYGRALAGNRLPPSASETLSAVDDASERFVTGLRLSEGVAPREFALRWPAAASRADTWEATLARFAKTGVVAACSGRAGAWRLTARGREVADAVMRELA